MRTTTFGSMFRPKTRTIVAYIRDLQDTRPSFEARASAYVHFPINYYNLLYIFHIPLFNNEFFIPFDVDTGKAWTANGSARDAGQTSASAQRNDRLEKAVAACVTIGLPSDNDEDGNFAIV